MDTVSPSKRSKIMAGVKSTGNRSTEAAIVKAFRLQHITGWRRQYPIMGKPDFCFPKSKLAVFVDGCFWHGCPNHCRIPSSNRKYWKSKIVKNVLRDVVVTKDLRKSEWKVIRIWEHEIKGDGLAHKLCRIKRFVNQSPAPLLITRGGQAGGTA